MIWIFVKFGLSAAVLVAASELAKRSAKLGALFISLPLVSLLAMLWLYADTQDTQKVAALSSSVFWLTLPSLPLFLIIPKLLDIGWGLPLAMAAGVLATMALYGVLAYSLPSLFA